MRKYECSKLLRINSTAPSGTTIAKRFRLKIAGLVERRRHYSAATGRTAGRCGCGFPTYMEAQTHLHTWGALPPLHRIVHMSSSRFTLLFFSHRCKTTDNTIQQIAYCISLKQWLQLRHDCDSLRLCSEWVSEWAVSSMNSWFWTITCIIVHISSEKTVCRIISQAKHCQCPTTCAEATALQAIYTKIRLITIISVIFLLFYYNFGSRITICVIVSHCWTSQL